MASSGDSATNPTTINEYMHRNIVTIPVEATLKEAAQKMADNQVGALLVTQNGQYVGIISEKRLAREGAAKGLNPETSLVQSVMRSQIISIESQEPVKEAQALMKTKAVRHLVVTENGNIVGVVSISDLIRYYTDFFDQDS